MNDYGRWPRRSYYADYEVREFALAAFALGAFAGFVLATAIWLMIP